MRLVDLVIQTIKESVRNDDKNFNVENFLNGNFDSDVEYSNEINNVLLSINKGISRLVTSDKLPYKHIVLVGDKDADIYDLSAYPIKNIKSVYIVKNNKIIWLGYQILSQNELFLGYGIDTNVHIIYEAKVHNFTEEDMYDVSFDENGKQIKTAKNIDLDEAYGISDEMCNYISYFAKSELYEDRDPDRCKRYLNYFEQFISELKVNRTYPHQDHVYATFRIGK